MSKNILKIPIQHKDNKIAQNVTTIKWKQIKCRIQTLEMYINATEITLVC